MCMLMGKESNKETEDTGKNEDNLCGRLQSNVWCFMGINLGLGKEGQLFVCNIRERSNMTIRI